MCVVSFFFLLQNNACAQHTAINIASADNLGYEMLSRPDYSPDLAASDLYLFSELKRKLKETNFEMKPAISVQLKRGLMKNPAVSIPKGLQSKRTMAEVCCFQMAI